MSHQCYLDRALAEQFWANRSRSIGATNSLRMMEGATGLFDNR
jgi:hypothetical protein